MSNKVIIELQAKDDASSQFLASMTRMEGGAKKFGQSMTQELGKASTVVDRLKAGWVQFAGVMGGGYLIKRGVEQIWELYKSTTAMADETAKMSKRLGISTEALSGLQFAAERSGVQVTTLNKGLQQMVTVISQAADGTGLARKSLQGMGVDIDNLNRMRPDEQFRAIADALSQVANKTDRVRIAGELFGQRGAGVLVLLEEGPKAIDAYIAEAERLGRVIGSDFAKDAEKAQDALTDLNSAFLGLKIDAVKEFAPAVTNMVGALTDLVTYYRENKDTIHAVLSVLFRTSIPGQIYTAMDSLSGESTVLYGPRGAAARRARGEKEGGSTPPSTSSSGSTSGKKSGAIWYGDLTGGNEYLLTGGSYLDPSMGRMAEQGKLAEQFAETYAQAGEEIKRIDVELAQHHAEKMREMEQTTNQIGRSMAYSFSGFFEDVISGTKSAGDAFGSMATNIIADIGRIVMYEAISKPFAEGIMGFVTGMFGHEGGLVTTHGFVKRHGGGPILGTGEVPTVLKTGEFVMREQAVASMPMSFWHGLNRMHSGGPVTAGSGGMMAGASPMNFEINMINETGTPAEAEVGSIVRDMDRHIINVHLYKLERSRSYRQAHGRR